ncbi:tRNA (uridine(34)/cytosine(34)/5-carboxymethylaminomethyluridine(34)-2'-O)-methyltransferase TrmL [Methylococcus sp. ANG]|uniref:tRNA (uridine(34)/cytosine(34)/5- carboxymethylaminomethyluridine(34)-2'-O)- methyltransferase TrmL n=1 Tax=unclassified Methylococcus TaxID=2618889 RepID=UPI001C52B1C5|nr:tRNA (uridine(34)/cytosine(34)/5-carboxymethylaminomethyluridine(34)-2'-O)-methyltransferase TrmL [Methylococcus sp. Mc7]QXP85944.1 tRNA (uridine(34)/cytosine(34)/5-carboxymethylaminomethyluridine(34)-2'-O)-methyltransferase TrmL [Methylococcus sp. Mc7]
MFHIVLYEPEIPPNTGNVIRLCANTGARLHLIEPLGFEMDDARLRRAGLDYREWAEVARHRDWDGFVAAVAPERMFALTTKGEVDHADVAYRPGDVFLFGPESRGLPAAMLARFDPGRRIRLPMRPGSRSLNLSNAVAVVCFEAWRQCGFEGAAPASGR